MTWLERQGFPCFSVQKAKANPCCPPGKNLKDTLHMMLTVAHDPGWIKDKL